MKPGRRSRVASCRRYGRRWRSRLVSKPSKPFPGRKRKISSGILVRQIKSSCCWSCQPCDVAADVVQAAPEEERDGLLALLDDSTRKEVTVLLAYAEDQAGGLMSPRFARVRPDMTADEAISYLHKQARERVETIYYVYVLDAQQRLVGVVSFRQLFEAPGSRKVRDLMQTEVVTVSEQMDQEDVGLLFARHS